MMNGVETTSFQHLFRPPAQDIDFAFKYILRQFRPPDENLSCGRTCEEQSVVFINMCQFFFELTKIGNWSGSNEFQVQHFAAAASQHLAEYIVAPNHKNNRLAHVDTVCGNASVCVRLSASNLSPPFSI